MRGCVLIFAVCACSNGNWNDTFTGTDTRTTGGGLAPLPGDGPDLDDENIILPSDGGASTACVGLAASSAPVTPITVTFPGHGTGTETVHVVVANGKSCDMDVDTDTDGVAYVSDSFACASLLAVGTPIAGTATASGGGAPNDLFFQWSYGSACTINDDYALSLK